MGWPGCSLKLTVEPSGALHGIVSEGVHEGVFEMPGGACMGFVLGACMRVVFEDRG